MAAGESIARMFGRIDARGDRNGERLELIALGLTKSLIMNPIKNLRNGWERGCRA